MKKHLLKIWSSLFVWVAGTMGPVQANKENLPLAIPSPAVVVVTQQARPVERSHPFVSHKGSLIAMARRYTYVFAGKAIHQGLPSSNTRVEVRVTSSSDVLIRNVTTGADGSYKVTLHLVGEPNDSMNWEINALSPDFQKVNLEGNQIMTEEPSIQMDVPLQFAEI